MVFLPHQGYAFTISFYRLPNSTHLHQPLKRIKHSSKTFTSATTDMRLAAGFNYESIAHVAPSSKGTHHHISTTSSTTTIEPSSPYQDWMAADDDELFSLLVGDDVSSAQEGPGYAISSTAYNNPLLPPPMTANNTITSNNIPPAVPFDLPDRNSNYSKSITSCTHHVAAPQQQWHYPAVYLFG